MSHSSNTERHLGFDFLKYICAFMVICIHVSYRGKTTLDPLTRAAVPVFFMITGYFYTYQKQKGRIKSQIKKILVLILLSNLCFILFDILLLLFQGAPVSAATAPWYTADAWINFLVFNTPPVWKHVWYLSALLYILVLIYLLEKVVSRKKLYILIPVLLCANWVLGTYSPLLFQDAPPLEWSRNFLFIGLPCFLLGDLLHEYKEKIRIRNITLIIIGIVFVAITLLEHRLLVYHHLCINQDFFISTPFMAAALFLLAERYEKLFRRKFFRQIAFMGKEYSLTIFILHPVLIRLISGIIVKLEVHFPVMSTIWFYTAPFIILLLSTLLAAGISFLTKRKESIKNKKD